MKSDLEPLEPIEPEYIEPRIVTVCRELGIPFFEDEKLVVKKHKWKACEGLELTKWMLVDFDEGDAWHTGRTPKTGACVLSVYSFMTVAECMELYEKGELGVRWWKANEWACLVHQLDALAPNPPFPDTQVTEKMEAPEQPLTAKERPETFVHLHVKSEYSILSGVCRVKKLPEAASERGFCTMALTDDSNLFGTMEFHKACKKAGIRPLVGAEINVQPMGVDHKDELEFTGYKLVVLVENRVGYVNLCALLTRGNHDGMFYRPRVDLSMLEQHSEGLVFITHSLRGPIRSTVRRLGIEDRKAVKAEVRNQLRDLRNAVGQDRLYVSLCDPGYGVDANPLCRLMAHLAGLKTVVTNAVHYIEPQDTGVLEVVQSMATMKNIQMETWTKAKDQSDQRPKVQTDQLYLKTEDELRELFPDDNEAFANTVEIANRCQFEFETGVYHFPRASPPEDMGTDDSWEWLWEMFPPPKKWELAKQPASIGDGGLVEYFRWYAREGLRQRLQEEPPEEYSERLEFEIAMIEKMGFPGYMLVVAEFINWAKDRDIAVGPARGSAAGSLVSWSMRITDIDPMKFDLLFERFLNPARVSMPDIDVDFEQARREEVIQHVRDKYGDEYVSQIVTYGSMKARAAIRDVARAIGMDHLTADPIAKMIPDKPGTKLQEGIDGEKLLRKQMAGNPTTSRLIEIAKAVEGMPKSLGVHAAGVLIADAPLEEYMPMYRPSPKDPAVGHFDMGASEGIGLVKFDFLGLKTLDQMTETVRLVKRNTGIDVDVSNLPWDDEKTFKMLQSGDAKGVFQLEGGGMRRLMVRLVPVDLHDLVVLVALYRPGPLQSGMVDDFVRRKHGIIPVEYYHPILEEVLTPTFGTIVYQEQVMRVAQLMAGYSLAEADLMRRAMGKKKQEEMDKQRIRFVDGSVENGYTEEQGTEMFNLLDKFAGYGFNKAHSAAYGYIAFQTAYLKAHYRTEFMAALLTLDSTNEWKITEYVADARKYGIKVLPPDINRSGHGFDALPAEKGKPRQIRFGLFAIKGVGATAVQKILEAREEVGGEFKSLIQFLAVTDGSKVTKRVVEALAKAGALDPLGVPRARIIAKAAELMKHRKKLKDTMKRKTPRKGEPILPSRKQLIMEFEGSFDWGKTHPWSIMKRMEAERAVLSTYVTDHPVDRYKTEIMRMSSCPIKTLQEVEPGVAVRIVGFPAKVREIRTKTGRKMAFVTLDDGRSEVECVVFPDDWAGSKSDLEADKAVIAFAKVEYRGGQVQLIISRARVFAGWRMTQAKKLTIKLHRAWSSPERSEELKKLLYENHGSAKTFLEVTEEDGTVTTTPLKKYPVRPTAEIEQKLEELFDAEGIVTVE